MRSGRDDTEGSGKASGGAMRHIGSAMALGTNLAAGMALFTFIGYWIDGKRGGGIFWTVCGMFMGLLYGAYEVWKVIRFMSEDSGGRRDESGPSGGKQGRE